MAFYRWALLTLMVLTVSAEARVSQGTGALEGLPTDQAYLLSVYISSNTYKPGIQQLVYKTQKFQTGAALYNADRKQALKLIGVPVDAYDGQNQDAMYAKYDRATYLRELSTTIDQEVQGLNFGDAPVGKIAKYAITGALASVTAPTGFAGSLAINSYSKYELDSYFSGIPYIPSKGAGDIDRSIIMDYSAQLSGVVQGGSDLAPYLKADMKKYGQIENPSNLKYSAEMKWDNFSKQFEDFKEKFQAKYDKTDPGLAPDQRRVNAAKEMTTDQLKNLSGLLEENNKLIKEQTEQAKVDQQKAHELQQRAQIMEATGAMIMTIASASGASPHDQRMINLAFQMADTMSRVVTSVAGNPMTYAGGYFAIASIAMSFVTEMMRQDDNSVSATLQAIEQLSKQIDDLRLDMLAEFGEVKSGLTVGFARQEYLLQAIMNAQRGQTQELIRISDQIKSTNNRIYEMLDAHFQRGEDLSWAICGDVIRQSEKASLEGLSGCRNSGMFLATSWATDSVSVARDFTELLQNKKNAQTPKAESDLMKEISRAIPLYARSKFGDGYSMANPVSWAKGTELYLRVLQARPDFLTTDTITEFDNIIGAGRQLREFYRTVFARTGSNSGSYTVDTSFVLKLLNDYQQKTKLFLAALEEKLDETPAPRNAFDQPLPGEVKDERTKVLPPSTKGKRAIDAFGQKFSLVQPTGPFQMDIVNVADHRQAPLGRGSWNVNEAKATFPGLVGTMKACLEKDGLKEEIVGGGPSIDAAKQDLNILKTRGLPLDASIIPLVPREALWLQKMHPKKFYIYACVSKYKAYQGGDNDLKRALSHYGYLMLMSSLQLTIEFRLKDLESGTGESGLKIGSAQTSMRLATPTPAIGNGVQVSDIWYPMLLAAWNKRERYSITVGPIQNNIDRYFTVNAPDDLVKKNLDYVRSLEEYEVAEIDKKAKDYLNIGDLQTKREDMQLAYGVLKTARVLNSAGIASIDGFFETLSKPSALLSPAGIEAKIIEGTSLKKMLPHLGAQYRYLKKKLALINGQKLDKAPSTPVDSMLGELELLEQQIPARH